MYIFILVSILLLFGLSVLAVFDYFVHTPKQRTATEQSFTVVNGQGLRAISTNLKNNKIISSDIMFMLYLKVSGLSGTIQSGEYSVNASMTPLTIADILTKGKVTSRAITIPEGWTNSDIGSYLEKQGIVKKSDFIAATKDTYKYDFLADKPADVGLEGFLFPDTYQVSVIATPESIVDMMLSNFDKRVTSDMRAVATKTGLGLYKTITLASIVELESNKPADRKLVAGVFIARLNEGMRLQSDVTVSYALGEKKEELTAADLVNETPYNTYLIDGLPKGPICNPGLDSINAVLYPENTAFRYFIAANDQVYYARTLEEHNSNVAKYLR
jgi:UPF0755 protein